MKKDFRDLPSVDRVLSDERVKRLAQVYSRKSVVDLVRAHLEEVRISIGAGNQSPSFDAIVESIYSKAQGVWQAGPRPLINATGVIIHTNLGRALLSEEAAAAALKVATSYSNLEFDLTRGERGSRQVHVEHLVCQLTGAEAALVVNNNASAVLLALTALAKDREVIVSRGEAVEIGGGFRIPDVMRQSGAYLVEVGTTNRTYLADYEGATTERTVALLRVHTSNFRVMGFTHSPTMEEMVDLGRRRGVSVLYDLGSGCLLDTTQFGLGPEPMPQKSIEAGVDLLFFSGDKLLGGPQAGIIVGKRQLVEKLAKHPLARAVRIDKMSLAALSATLLHYVNYEAVSKIPVWRMIATHVEELEMRVRAWVEAIDGKGRIVDGHSTIGGGSLPGETLPTRLLAIAPEETPLSELTERLRTGIPPVIGRVEENRLLLDPRTVLPEEDKALLRALRAALPAQGS